MDLFYNEFLTNNFESPPVGSYTWQHIVFVICCLVISAGLAAIIYFCGGKGKNKDGVYNVAAIILLSFEFIKYVVIIIAQGHETWLVDYLPLRGNTIVTVTIPLLAWSKGRNRQVWKDFAMLFGLVAGASLFTYEMLFNHYPLWHFNTLICSLTCSISFFVAMYILFAEDYSLSITMVKKTVIVLALFTGIAYFINAMTGSMSNPMSESLTGANYMHLKYPASSPFRILYNVFESSFWYTLSVALVNLAYLIIASYLIALIRNAIYRNIRN